MSGEKLSAEWNYKKALRPKYAYSRRLFGSLAVNGLACLAARNQPQLAARLFGAAETWNPYLKNLLYRLERETREEVLADLRKELGEVLFAQLWAEGRAIPLERLANWVLEQVGDAEPG